MWICPVCNGFRTVKLACPDCDVQMADKGRLSDYFDDYSPYMEIDGMKLEDGFEEDYRDHQCVHLFQCERCGNERLCFIREHKSLGIEENSSQ